MKGSKKLAKWLQKRDIRAKIIPTSEKTPSVEDSSKVLGIDKEDIVKSLVFNSNVGVIVAIVQGTKRVSEKKLKQATGATWVKLAKPKTVRKATGYPVGGVPPIGHKQSSLIYILDKASLNKEWIYGGGGDTTSQLKIKVEDLERYLNPTIADIGM